MHFYKKFQQRGKYPTLGGKRGKGCTTSWRRREEREREWCKENAARVDVLVAERRQEIQRIEELQKEAKERVHLLEEYSHNVRGALRNRVEKVHEIEDLPKEFHVLGYRQTHGTLYGSGRIYVLQEEREGDMSTIPFPVWATKRLDTILRNQHSLPDTKKTKDVRVYVDFGGTKKIQISILEKKSFRTRDGEDRFFCPIDVLEVPRLLDISLVDKEMEKMYGAMEPTKKQRLSHRPTIPKERKTKLADFAEGEYVCSEYSSFEYRGKTRYALFLGEEGRSATGFWIDEEMAKIVDDLPFAPMLCKVGKMARTKNGHKGRKIVFCIAEATPTNPHIAKEEQETPPNPCIAEATPTNPHIAKEEQETPPNLHIAEEEQETPPNPSILEEEQETPPNTPILEEQETPTNPRFAGKRKVFVPPVPTRDTIRTEEESMGDAIDRVFLEMWGRRRTKSTSLHVGKERLQKWKGLLVAKV